MRLVSSQLGQSLGLHLLFFFLSPSLLYCTEPSLGGAGESMGKAEEELTGYSHSSEGDRAEPLPNAGTEYG